MNVEVNIGVVSRYNIRRALLCRRGKDTIFSGIYVKSLRNDLYFFVVTKKGTNGLHERGPLQIS